MGNFPRLGGWVGGGGSLMKGAGMLVGKETDPGMAQTFLTPKRDHVIVFFRY